MLGAYAWHASGRLESVEVLMHCLEACREGKSWSGAVVIPNPGHILGVLSVLAYPASVPGLNSPDARVFSS